MGFEEIKEWKRLQEKQPAFSENTRWGGGEGRMTVRRYWDVMQSNYGDSEKGTGVILYRTSKNNLLVRAFSPMYDLEAYTQICEERGWTPVSF